MQCTTWKLGPISVYRTRLGSPRVRSERLSHRMEDVPRFEARASELSPLDYTNYPKPLIGLGFFLAYRSPDRLNNRQTGSILKTFRKF